MHAVIRRDVGHVYRRIAWRDREITPRHDRLGHRQLRPHVTRLKMAGRGEDVHHRCQREEYCRDLSRPGADHQFAGGLYTAIRLPHTYRWPVSSDCSAL
jgi:hypothetical protein